MSKHKLEFSVECDAPDGYEFSRLSQHSDCNVGEKLHGSVDIFASSYYVIVRKSWQWPEWLTAEWIAMDKGCEWWSYESKPYVDECVWSSGDGMMRIDSKHIAFTPPPCTDWTQSLRRRPKAEVTK